MKAKDMLSQLPFLKVGVYGDSGTGKSTWAARSPRPYILLTEAHAVPAIARANPEAEIELLNDWETMVDAVNDMSRGAAKTGPDGQMGLAFKRNGEVYFCQSIVIDSFNDLNDKAKDTYFDDDAPEKQKGAMWGRIQNEMRAILGKLRSCPANVVCVGLAAEREDNHKRIKITPQLFGSLRGMFGQWFNAMGYARKSERSGELEYQIAWSLPSRYVTKALPQFPIASVNTDEPGVTTLGSLAHAVFGDLETLPRREGDHRDNVRGPAMPAEVIEKQDEGRRK